MDADTTVNADSTARPAAPALAPAGLAPAELASADLAGAGSGALAVSQPPTIYDVARAAGVSIASVSRVLNGRRNPRPETRDRVLQAVAELGFVPDDAARALSARLKEVGTRARQQIEALLGTRIYLDLHVKIAKDWQRNPRQLRRLGFYD